MKSILNLYRIYFKKYFQIFVIWAIYTAIVCGIRKIFPHFFLVRNPLYDIKNSDISVKQVITQILCGGIVLPLVISGMIIFTDNVLCPVEKIDGEWRRKKYAGYIAVVKLLSAILHAYIASIALVFHPKWFNVVSYIFIFSISIMHISKWNKVKKIGKGISGKREITEKEFVAYLNTSNFLGDIEYASPMGYDYMSNLAGVKKEKDDSLEDILIGNGKYLLCPYWFYKENIEGKYKTERTGLIVVLDVKHFRSFSERQNQIILDIVKSYVNRGDDVMILYDNTVFSIEMSTIGGGLLDELRLLPITFLNNIDTTSASMEQFLSGHRERDIAKDEELFSAKYDYDVDKELRKFCIQTDEYDKRFFISKKILDIGLDSQATDFYSLIRMVEYCIHYRALERLASGEVHIPYNKEQIFNPGMGQWCILQEFKGERCNKNQKPYVWEAYNLIAEIIAKPVCEEVDYQMICNLLKDVRNKYIGHGTMAFSVSDNLLEAVKILSVFVFDIFYKEKESLDSNAMDSNGIPLFLNNSLLVTVDLSGEEAFCEYLNYAGGYIQAPKDEMRKLVYAFREED